MGLFSPRQGADARELAGIRDQLDAIRTQLSNTQSELRSLQAEQISLHTQVHKWMRRALAAQTASERNQEPAPARAALAAQETPAPIRGWGARGRRAARLQREALADLQTLAELGGQPGETVENGNGVHS